MRPATIKTKIHIYEFNLGDADQARAYRELREKLEQDKDRRFFNCNAEPGKELELQDGEIELETKFLFADQWNSTTARVFDWYEGIYRHIKRGHWLEMTDEMRALRQNVLVCGFCGANYDREDFGGEFCVRCLGSEYLKESQIHLLRLLSVAAGRFSVRAELSDTERTVMLPLYIDRQTKDSESRAVARRKKVREDVENKFLAETEAARIEHDGFIWLLDHDISIENCIYYSHTGKFSFGWRQPVSEGVKSRLLEMLTEFGYSYEIKAESGVTSTTAAK